MSYIRRNVKLILAVITVVSFVAYLLSERIKVKDIPPFCAALNGEGYDGIYSFRSDNGFDAELIYRNPKYIDYDVISINANVLSFTAKNIKSGKYEVVVVKNKALQVLMEDDKPILFPKISEDEKTVWYVLQESRLGTYPQKNVVKKYDVNKKSKKDLITTDEDNGFLVGEGKIIFAEYTSDNNIIPGIISDDGTIKRITDDGWCMGLFWIQKNKIVGLRMGLEGYFSYDLETGEKKLLLNKKDTFLEYPKMSKNGKYLIGYAYRNYFCRSGNEFICVMDMQGNRLKELTKYRRSANGGAHEIYYGKGAFNVVWME